MIFYNTFFFKKKGYFISNTNSEPDGYKVQAPT